MTYRTLGRDGLRVSSVGLGCMGMSHAYGAPADKTEMTSLLYAAIDLGCTFFDTAEVYGTAVDPHHNECLLGEALTPLRDRVVISTKFGISFEGVMGTDSYRLVPDSRPETIRRSVEGSLRRLQTDRIDLYFQHRIDPNVSPEEVAGCMAELMREGKILHWGISETGAEYLRRAHAVCPVTAVQNRYSMMYREYEALFPVLQETGVGFVAFSPLANGLLSDCYTTGSRFDAASDYRAAMPQFLPGSYEKNRGLLCLLRDLAAEHGATPAQISLAWMLCKRPWIVPIPGTRRLLRLEENLGAVRISLSPGEVEEIDNKLDATEMSDVFSGALIKKQK